MKVTFKNELGKRVSDKIKGVSKTRVNYLVNAFIGEIQDALKRGETVELRGLGRLSVRPRKARPGRHPQSGVPIMLPAHKVVHFRPADDLNRKFNGAKRPMELMSIPRVDHAQERAKHIDSLGGTGL